MPSRPRRRARIRQFIAFFDLSFETLTDKMLGAYSKGMRRKVVITAALLHNPPVVFFDEPLASAVLWRARQQAMSFTGPLTI